MTVTTLERPATADLWEDRPQVTPVHTRLRSHLHITEIGLLTLVALGGYIAVAVWIQTDLHFWLNDALDRSTDAVYVTVGRDPHLAAIGFYWPPLAQLVQLPFAPICTRFGAGIMAGPLSSAFCMALTIPVLARIGKASGLRRHTTFVICVIFAANPIIVYYAANGMSEACFFLFGAIALLGFLRYTQNTSIPNILVFSAGLCGVVMTRLEGPFVALVLVLVAVFEVRHLKRSAWNAFLIGGPPMVMFGLWLLVQWIIENDPLFFQHQSDGGAPPKPGHAIWLPNTAKDPLSALPWAAHWLLVLGPAVILVAVVAVVRPHGGKLRAGIGLVGACFVFLAIQIDQIITGTGYGDPRYFITAILFATVGVLWMAEGPPRMFRPKGRSVIAGVWNVALIASLVVAAGTGTHTLTSARLTHVEDECVFFQYGSAKILPLLGRTQQGPGRCGRPVDVMKPWQQAAAYLDGHVTGHDRIIADNRITYPIDLFTTKPQLFVVQNDRDWQKIVTNPISATYVVTESPTRLGKPADASASEQGPADTGAQIIGYTPKEWHLVASYGGARTRAEEPVYVQVYHFVPSAPGQHPQGSESGLD